MRLRTLFGSHRKLRFSDIISVTRALEDLFTTMRYINRHFTYLHIYLSIYR